MNQFDQLLISCRDNPNNKFLWEVARDLCEEIHGHRMIELYIPSFPLLGWNGWITRRYRRTAVDPNFHPSQLSGLTFLMDTRDYGPPIAIFDRELTPEENQQMSDYAFTMYGVTLPTE